jgi:hypothetical protein
MGNTIKVVLERLRPSLEEIAPSLNTNIQFQSTDTYLSVSSSHITCTTLPIESFM